MKKSMANEPGRRRSRPTPLIKAATPTLKAGELDAGLDLRGPDAKGHYTVLAGLKVQQGADIEKLLRHSRQGRRAGPEQAQTGRGQGRRRQHPPGRDRPRPQPADATAKKLFGGSPDVYFAIRDDAILVAAGSDALAALKDAVTVKPATGPTIQVELSVSRIAALMTDQNPSAPEIAKKVFADAQGQDPPRPARRQGPDPQAQPGRPLISFAAQLQEAKGK